MSCSSEGVRGRPRAFRSTPTSSACCQDTPARPCCRSTSSPSKAINCLSTPSSRVSMRSILSTCRCDWSRWAATPSLRRLSQLRHPHDPTHPKCQAHIERILTKPQRLHRRRHGVHPREEGKGHHRPHHRTLIVPGITGAIQVTSGIVYARSASFNTSPSYPFK